MTAFPPSVWSAEGSPRFVPWGPVRGTLMWSCSVLVLGASTACARLCKWCLPMFIPGLFKALGCTENRSWFAVGLMFLLWLSVSLLLSKSTFWVASVRSTVLPRGLVMSAWKKKNLHFLPSFWKIMMYTKASSLIIPSIFEMMACLWSESWTLESRTKENREGINNFRPRLHRVIYMWW